jgi:hypothetical protein
MLCFSLSSLTKCHARDPDLNSCADFSFLRGSMRSYGHSFLRGKLNRIMVVRFGSVSNDVKGDGKSRARSDRVKKKAMTKKKWADHHLVARVSLLIVLMAFVKWSGTTPYDESIDENRVSRGGPPSLSSQPRRWRQRQQQQDHRRVKATTTSSKSLQEAIASATSSSDGRDVVLQFSLGKIVATNAEDQEEDRVKLFRAVESAMLRVLCRRSNEASEANRPIAVVSGDTLDDVGSDMCVRWGRRSSLRSLGQGLGKQPRRQLQGADNNEESIPVPNVFALVNGTLDDDDDAGEMDAERTNEEAVDDSGSSPYSSDHTVLTGRVSRWRLQDTLLSSADDEEDGTETLHDPSYYTVWTVHYPVLQLGDSYWEQQLQLSDALENGASEEHLAVYTYDDDASAAAAAGGDGGSENRTGSAMALDLLRRELQHQVNVAIRNLDFDRTLRQAHVTTYKASVVGREPVTFATEGGAGTTSNNTSNGAGTSRQIALAVLYGLAGLIAGAVLVLLGCYLRRMRAVRSSSKEKKAKASAKKGNAGGSTYDSTLRHTDEKGADGRSITSASSFLHADHDDDPGYCWIPIPNIVRTPTSSYADTDSSSRGWLHSQDGDFSGSCSDPLMVLMETDDDEDDDDSNIDEKEGDGVNNMDILDEEASLLTTVTAASVTTVEVDLDTCQVVNLSPPKRVRFDPSLWTEEIPNLHHPGHCANDADDAGSVSSLSDAAGAASDRMDRFDALPPVSLCGGSADANLGNLHPSSFDERPGATASRAYCVNDGELMTAVDPTPQRNADDGIETIVTPAMREVEDPCVVKAAVLVRQGDVAAGGLDERQMVTPS